MIFFDEYIIENNAIDEACKNGDLKLVKEKYENKVIKRSNYYKFNYFKIAAKGKHYELTEWIYNITENPDYSYDNTLFSLACYNGHKEEAQKIYNQIGKNFYSHTNTFYNSCSSGNLELVKWVYGLEKTWNTIGRCEVIDRSCKSGNLELVKWLFYKFDFKDEGTVLSFFYYACRGGNLELVKWLDSIFEKKYINYNIGFVQSCRSGNLKLIKWLYYNKNVTIDKNGDCINSMNSWFCPYFSESSYECKYALQAARISDSYNIVEWLFNQGVKLIPYQDANNEKEFRFLYFLEYHHNEENNKYIDYFTKINVFENTQMDLLTMYQNLEII